MQKRKGMRPVSRKRPKRGDGLVGQTTECAKSASQEGSPTRKVKARKLEKTVLLEEAGKN